MATVQISWLEADDGIVALEGSTSTQQNTSTGGSVPAEPTVDAPLTDAEMRDLYLRVQAPQVSLDRQAAQLLEVQRNTGSIPGLF